MTSDKEKNPYCCYGYESGKDGFCDWQCEDCFYEEKKIKKLNTKSMPQDKINHQRKATFQEHSKSGEFWFMNESEQAEAIYTLAFMEAGIFLTKQYIKDIADLKTELTEARELITNN